MFKKIILFVFFSYAAASPSSSKPEGNSVQNAGDVVAMQFVTLARSVFTNLDLSKFDPELRKPLQRIQNSLDDIKVHSEERIYLDESQIDGSVEIEERFEINGKVEVDAINYPGRKLIVLNGPRWVDRRFSSFTSKLGFITHEYLGVLGFNDHQYRISSRILSQLDSPVKAKLAAQDEIFQKLRQLQDTYFWYTLNADNGITISQLCLDTGMLSAWVEQVSHFLSHHSDMFISSDRTHRNMEILKKTNIHLLNMCVQEEINYKDLKKTVNEAWKISGEIEFSFNN